jgi:hypothetical protein
MAHRHVLGSRGGRVGDFGVLRWGIGCCIGIERRGDVGGRNGGCRQRKGPCVDDLVTVNLDKERKSTTTKVVPGCRVC